MSRKQRELLQTFQALGMKRLSDLEGVPQSAWGLRFGQSAETFFENIKCSVQFPWIRLVPSLELKEETHWNAEDCVMDSEALIFRLKPLTDRLMSRLFAMGRALKKLQIEMRLDRPVPNRVLSVSFTFPQTSKVLLLKLIRERLSQMIQKEPLSDPIVSAEVRVIESTSRVSSEENLFSGVGEQHHPEKWVEMISFLGLKLKKEEQVFQAETTEHLLPENSWKKAIGREFHATQSLDSVSHFFAERPITLFSEPKVLSRVGSFLKQEGRLWKICSFAQEECLQGYDWDVDETKGFFRRYFRVKVESPDGFRQEWWIFKDERLGTLRLHGVY
jgi:hypothetical protein